MNIYEHVLGHQYIYPNNLGLTYRILPISDRKCFVCTCQHRTTQIHQSCTPDPRLHCDLLATCRQIYSEAFPVFWSTNTFCLQDREIVSGLFRSLKPHQRHSIRKIRLFLRNFLGTSHVGWDPAVSRIIWDTMSGLQRLELFISYYHSTCLPENGKRPRESHLSGFVLKLSALTFKSAKVWIENATWDRITFNETHDVFGEMSPRICAERIERMLLDKDYAHDQCEKQKALDESWARSKRDVGGALGFQRALSSNPYR